MPYRNRLINFLKSESSFDARKFKQRQTIAINILVAIFDISSLKNKFEVHLLLNQLLLKILVPVEDEISFWYKYKLTI